jgi:hypothetical protein
MSEITLILTIKPHPATPIDEAKGLAGFAGSETQRLCDYLHERGHVATFDVDCRENATPAEKPASQE